MRTRDRQVERPGGAGNAAHADADASPGARALGQEGFMRRARCERQPCLRLAQIERGLTGHAGRLNLQEVNDGATHRLGIGVYRCLTGHLCKGEAA
jgi:hypothetical protein